MASNASTANGASTKPRSRLGVIVVAVVAVFLTAASAYRILSAVFDPPLVPTELSCGEGTRQLLASVERARERAAAQAHGERAALADFRTALEPEWAVSATIRNKCKASMNPSAIAAYRAVELLRYAEERAVRYEAIDLSRLRQRAPRLVSALTSTSAKNQAP